jgi:hypothetical protein
MSLTSSKDALRHLAIRALLRLYPQAWRRRYGIEFEELLAQSPLGPLEVADVVRGAIDARWVASRNVPARSATALQESLAPAAGLEHWRTRRNGRERAMTGKHRQLSCSFCGKSQDQVRRLIAGPNGVYICDACVTLCNQIIVDAGFPPSCEQSEGARPAVQRQAVPRWQRLLRRWLESRWSQNGANAYR